MIRLSLLVIVMLGVAAGCRDQSTEPRGYPIWILRVQVREFNGTANVNVQGCPRVVWRFSEDPDGWRTVPCYRGTSDVFVQEPISSPVRILYTVECDGYFPSELREAQFFPEEAIQEPGRPGPEVWVRDLVVLIRV